MSVPGRGVSHSAPISGIASDRIGLIETNSTPRALAARSAPGRVCRPTPPEVICAFFTGSPPNITSRRVFPTMLFHEVARSSSSDPNRPTICWLRTSTAAWL